MEEYVPSLQQNLKDVSSDEATTTGKKNSSHIGYGLEMCVPFPNYE